LKEDKADPDGPELGNLARAVGGEGGMHPGAKRHRARLGSVRVGHAQRKMVERQVNQALHRLPGMHQT
jgi:hypothetical protein